MCMGKTPKPAKPPGAPPPAPDLQEVTSLKFNEATKEADNAASAVASKRRGRKALRIERNAVGTGGGINIPG